jgi:hypothetical protein
VTIQVSWRPTVLRQLPPDITTALWFRSPTELWRKLQRTPFREVLQPLQKEVTRHWPSFDPYRQELMGELVIATRGLNLQAPEVLLIGKLKERDKASSDLGRLLRTVAGRPKIESMRVGSQTIPYNTFKLGGLDLHVLFWEDYLYIATTREILRGGMKAVREPAVPGPQKSGATPLLAALERHREAGSDVFLFADLVSLEKAIGEGWEPEFRQLYRSWRGSSLQTIDLGLGVVTDADRVSLRVFLPASREPDGLLAMLSSAPFSPYEIRAVPQKTDFFLSVTADIGGFMKTIAAAEFADRPDRKRRESKSLGVDIDKALDALGDRFDTAAALDPRYDDMEGYVGFALGITDTKLFEAMLERYRTEQEYEKVPFEGHQIYTRYGEAFAVSEGRLVFGEERPYAEDVLRQLEGKPRRLEPKLAASLPDGPVNMLFWCNERMLQWVLRQMFNLDYQMQRQAKGPSDELRMMMRLVKSLGPATGRATWQGTNGYLIELDLLYR